MNISRQHYAAATALIAALQFTPAIAHAAVSTTGCGGGSSCTMSQLLAGGTITAGDVTFSSFDDTLAVDFPDTDMVVITGVDDGTLAPGPGFDFAASPDFAVTGGGDFFYRFSFDIDAAGGASIISDASLALTGFSGTDGFDDTVTVSALVPSSDPLPAEVSVDDTSTTDSFDLAAAVSTINVDHRILVDAFFGDGATLTDYEFRVSLVPVPAALPLLLSGIAMLGVVRVRRHR